MRKCVVLGIAFLAAFSLTLPTQASAQHVFLGAGATFPTGDYGDYAKTGWVADAGIGFPIGENGLILFGEGMYGSNKHSDFEGDKTDLLGGFGGVEYDFSSPGEAGLFVFGQAGFLRHGYKSDQYEESTETGFAFGGGAGYGIPIGGMSGWVLGRYLQGQFDDGNTAFYGVMAGLSIPIGGN